MDKRCTKCGTIQLVSEFYKDKRRKDGLTSWCRECILVAHRAYRKTEKGKKIRRKTGTEYQRKYRKTENGKKAIRRHEKTEKRKLSYRKSCLKRKFSMTLEQYDKMFEEQGGVCAICGGLNDRGYRLAVDHDHKTGKIRGLLCSKCNLNLSAFEDINWRHLAEDYLHDHRS